MKILLIEDDKDTADYIHRGLKEEGHTVDVAGDGKTGLLLASTEQYDVLVVDRMLPELDGLSLVKTLRGIDTNAPVLFLTTLGGVDDRVEGLDAGGDDYLVKPFAFSEFIARVNALGRRSPFKEKERNLRVADLEMDLVARAVTRAGTRIDLQPREFKLQHVS